MGVAGQIDERRLDDIHIGGDPGTAGWLGSVQFHSRFSVLVSVNGALSRRWADILPTSTAITGS